MANKGSAKEQLKDEAGSKLLSDAASGLVTAASLMVGRALENAENFSQTMLLKSKHAYYRITLLVEKGKAFDSNKCRLYLGSLATKTMGNSWGTSLYSEDGYAIASAIIEATRKEGDFTLRLYGGKISGGPLQLHTGREGMAGTSPVECLQPYPMQQFERLAKSIEELREDEGNSVTIVNDNPEGGGSDPVSLVEVMGVFTNWEIETFTGTSLQDALDNAIRRKREWEAAEKAAENQCNPRTAMRLKPGKENELRQCRKEVLMAGDGEGGLPEHEAHEAAFNHESIEDILAQDGDHLAETNPELFDFDEPQRHYLDKT